MVGSLLAAGIGLFAIAAVHSVLGEILLLRHFRNVTGFPIVLGSDALAKGTTRATWHVASVFGVGLGAILCRYAYMTRRGESEWFVVKTIAVALFACGVLVLVGTKGRHPGWVGFFVTATLCWLALRGA